MGESGIATGSGSSPIRLCTLTALAVLLAASPTVVAWGSQPSARYYSPMIGTDSASVRLLPHPHLGLHPPQRTAQGNLFYFQEGFTIGTVNSSSFSTSSLSEIVPVVRSPYSIGYELNGLTDTGDWWQVVIGDNWPGCNAGFEEITEVWAVGDVSGPVNCDSNVTIVSGDMVELKLNFTPSGKGCLGLIDLTRSVSHYECQSQPDPGASSWVYLSSVANSDGYFTGPMSEVVNLTATSCPDYTYMPRVEYEFPAGFFVTAYTPWSDEFDAAGGTLCYQSSGAQFSVVGKDPTSQYIDTASGTAYGPHYSDGQNYSLRNSSFGFRYETDTVPITGVGLTASATIIGPGSNVTFSLTASGGVPSFSALWYMNGLLFVTTPGLTWTWTSGGAGTYAIAGYPVDQKKDVGTPTSWVNVTVPRGLVARQVQASPAGGIDVGQTVNFSIPVAGGFPPYTVTWNGLPPGCSSANQTKLPCAPSFSGAVSVSAVISDSNGSTVGAPALNYTVFSTPTAVLAGGPSLVDVGQHIVIQAGALGGAGGFRFTWVALPPGCTGTIGGTANCSLSSTGVFPVSVTATDSFGYTTAAAWSNLTVNSDPVAALQTNRSVADVGQSVMFQVTATGGSGGLSYEWSGLPSDCPPGSTSVVICLLSSAGTLSVAANVTDAAGFTVRAVAIVLTVHPAPTGILDVVSPSVVAGSELSIAANVTGGTPGYRYNWTGLPSDCVAMGRALTCQPTSPGSYSIVVYVEDSAGVIITLTTVITVTPGSAPVVGSWPLLAFGVIAAAAAVGVGSYVVRRRRRRAEGSALEDSATAQA